MILIEGDKTAAGAQNGGAKHAGVTCVARGSFASVPRTVAATMPHAKPPEKHFLGKLGPLCNAAYFGETDEVKALLDKGTDPDERGGDLNFTPLMLASMTKSGNFPIAEMLLQAGASVEAKDNSFNNALAIACSGGDERIVKMLIEGGSDVNNLNRGKWGPLTLAVKHLNGAAAKLVLEAGADANQRTQGICAPWGLHALDILNDHRTPTGGSVSYLDGIDIRKLLKEKTTVPTARELKVQEDERRAKVAAEKAAAEATGAPTPAAVEVA